MKITWLSPEWMYPIRDALVDVKLVYRNPDVILCMSVSQMDKAIRLVEEYPRAKLYNYNWDVYEWIWDKPRYEGEDELYKKYGEFIKKGKVWCPSKCTVKRTKQWFGIDSVVIKTFVPLWEHKTKDLGYILNPAREIPDRYWGRFEIACKELGIPCKGSTHDLPWEEYQELVAGARFIVSPLYEMSTGSLTAIEGYNIGIPVLFPDSVWHGGVDYLGDKAVYFKHDSEEDLKRKIKDMWNKPPKTIPLNKEEFSAETMAKEIQRQLCV